MKQEEKRKEVPSIDQCRDAKGVHKEAGGEPSEGSQIGDVLTRGPVLGRLALKLLKFGGDEVCVRRRYASEATGFRSLGSLLEPRTKAVSS